jgi:hypothetical protein
VIKRYDWNDECDGECGRCRADLIPDESGDWVEYEDYQLLEEMSRSDLNAACALVASAGLATGHADSAAQLVAEVLDQVADIRAEAERLQQKRNEIIEECAELCDRKAWQTIDKKEVLMAGLCAAAIRALKEGR